jgi:hypothetical protein
MHMRHHVTNHLIISNDKDSNSENRIKLRVRDTPPIPALKGKKPRPLCIQLYFIQIFFTDLFFMCGIT